MDVWKNQLNQEERKQLQVSYLTTNFFFSNHHHKKYLPVVENQNVDELLTQLFDGTNFFFGNPVEEFTEKMKG